jgi:hypothetical protein
METRKHFLLQDEHFPARTRQVSRRGAPSRPATNHHCVIGVLFHWVIKGKWADDDKHGRILSLLHISVLDLARIG